MTSKLGINRCQQKFSPQTGPFKHKRGSGFEDISAVANRAVSVHGPEIIDLPAKIGFGRKEEVS